jgi:hybrid cluster-associated redox disulfide protein
MCLRGRKRGISIMTITKDMSIGEVVQKYPATVEVFLRHGLMCFGCAVARFESIEQGALAHGMDVDALLRDLNAAVSEEPETAAPAER